MSNPSLRDSDRPGPAAATPHRTSIIICHNGLRAVSAEDVAAAAGGLAALGGVPVVEVINTGRFAEEIDNGVWGPSQGEIWRRAREIRERLRDTPGARVLYAGMPEVPHAVAFGAYLEEPWLIELYDFHDGVLGWPTQERTLNLGEPTGLPRDVMTTAGPAVLRVEISYSIANEQVRQFVSEEEQIADVRIAPEAVEPRLGLVRSLADVEEVRRAVRHAITTLVERRPKLTTIHLFVAAPVSACVVTGQELRLRNHPPVQTYRHRRDGEGRSRTTEAMRLSALGPEPVDVPLTLEQTQRAAVLRTQLWAGAIADIERYAARKDRQAERSRKADVRERWYDGLPWDAELQRVRPFPALPPVYAMVKRPATVDPRPFDREGFGFQRDDRVWRINDGFSVRLTDHFPKADAARALTRIFLFHEYLHEVHGITKESYREVGKFANALERADYMCDLYGMLHEIDLEADADATLRRDFDRYKSRVGELIDLVLRSFWVFEREAPLDELEIRRIRRYMNWYWQQVRIRRAETPVQIAAILARQPVVEIAGLATRAEGRRYYGSLKRLDPDVGLEMGIILDNERLLRVKTGVNTPLHELMIAFRQHNHDEIQEFFRHVFTEAEGTGHALPREDDLP